MPAPLPEPTTKVKWRIWTEDLELLEAVHGPGSVNAVVRAILHSYCARKREQLRNAGVKGVMERVTRPLGED